MKDKRKQQRSVCVDSQRFFLDRAFERLGLEDDIRVQLLNPFRETRISIPLKVRRNDDSVLLTFTGFRVQHNNARGPFKGGLRFHPRITLEDTRQLAQLMTWKTALVEIPFGGAKGGIVVDPKMLGRDELEWLTKRFAQKMEPVLGLHVDVMAPDIGTTPQVMAWILEEYSKAHGYTPGVVTGKPLELAGSPGRLEATGHGVAFLARKVASERSLNLEGARVVIQGFGNVASHAARSLSAMGARIIALSSSIGGVHCEQGIDVAAAQRYYLEGGTLQGFPGCEEVSNAELLTLPCDILIPAAIQGTITVDIVDALRAPLIVEAANMAVTCDADQALMERGVVIVPDLVANAGGVLASYYEWVQNLQEFPWDFATVIQRLERRLLESYEQVRDLAYREGVDLRTAAYELAVKRVSHAAALRGL